MKLLFFGTMSVPACWFNLFNIIAVLIGVPIINRYVYPCLSNYGMISPFLFRMSIGKIYFVFLNLSVYHSNCVMYSYNKCTNLKMAKLKQLSAVMSLKKTSC